jgi:hypothetical protein
MREKETNSVVSAGGDRGICRRQEKAFPSAQAPGGRFSSAAEFHGAKPPDNFVLLRDDVGLPENCPEHEAHCHSAHGQNERHLRF